MPTLHEEIKKLLRPICWIKTCWRTFWSVIFTGFDMDGHDYVEQKNGDLVCEICGYVLEEKINKKVAQKLKEK